MQQTSSELPISERVTPTNLVRVEENKERQVDSLFDI